MGIELPFKHRLACFSERQLLGLVCAVLVGGCVQTHWQSASGPSQTLATPDQMMDVEETDRVRRFERLSQLAGIVAPQIDQGVVPAASIPGASRPIPVIRVMFGERVFFDTGSAAPRPEAASVMKLISDNMRRDVPDLRVTVLGHTDAVGSDAANVALSEQRAQAVLQVLVRNGVNPAQLGTVAIGKAQPIAPNNTVAGRARNRRVEFLISPSEEANLQMVQKRQINSRFLTVDSSDVSPRHSAPPSVRFLKPTYSGPADFAEAPLAQRRIALTAVKELQLQQTASDIDDTGSPVPRSKATSQTEPLESGSPVARQ